jgi:hypothetical protein
VSPNVKPDPSVRSICRAMRGPVRAASQSLPERACGTDLTRECDSQRK